MASRWPTRRHPNPRHSPGEQQRYGPEHCERPPARGHLRTWLRSRSTEAVPALARLALGGRGRRSRDVTQRRSIHGRARQPVPYSIVARSQIDSSRPSSARRVRRDPEAASADGTDGVRVTQVQKRRGWERGPQNGAGLLPPRTSIWATTAAGNRNEQRVLRWAGLAPFVPRRQTIPGIRGESHSEGRAFRPSATGQAGSAAGCHQGIR